MDTFLSRFSWSSASRYRTTILIWLTLLVFGALSYTSFLDREGFPAVNVPYAIVQGTYSSEDPTEVNQQVVRPITEILNGIDEITSYQTTAGASYFSVVTEFNDTTTSDEGAELVRQALSDSSNIPSSAAFEIRTINAAKFLNQYNLLFAVYQQTDTPYSVLEQQALVAAEAIAAKNGISKASVLPISEEFTDPATGQTSSRQTAINRIGIREGSGITYYPAVSIGVIRDDSIDDTELYDSVNTGLTELQNNDSFNQTKVSITADFATQISTQINSLQNNLLGGLLAVLLVALLFISWRAAIVVALFIPTVVAVTMLGLTLLGFTLNTITLFALILTLGLFVDDATILVEAIDAHRKDKTSAKQIIKNAVRRVGIASVAGTLTTVLVFTPMLFVSGVLGEFIRLMPITVILALLSSLVISLALIPFLSRIFVIGAGNQRVLDSLSLLVPAEQWLAKKLSKLPIIAQSRPKKGAVISGVLIGISIAGIIIGGLFFSRLNFQIFPPSEDSDSLLVNIDFPESATLTDVDEYSRQIDTVVAETLKGDLQYVTYLNANPRGVTIELGLTPYQERDLTSLQLIDQLNTATDSLSGADITINQVDAGPPTQDYPFQMRIYSNDTSVLDRVTSDIQSALQNTTLNAGNNPVVVTKVDRGGLQTITTTNKGRFATVSAQYNNTENVSAAVAATKDYITGQFDSDYLTTAGLSADTLDFNVSQESDNAESFSSIGTGIIIALVLMYALLVALYNSFSQPLLIFMAIPFSFFGVAVGLWATDTPLSFFVMLGFLGLIGIVVNNSILLVEYANQEREAGADRHSAIASAVKDRLRPLLTTTFTTIVALLPLAVSDPFWQPLAYTLIFGMASSVVFIVLSFPYYYLIFESIRDAKNRRFPSLR